MEHTDQANKAQPEPQPAVSPDPKSPAPPPDPFDVNPDGDSQPPAGTDPFDV
jgi:hypothetical protein